MLVRKLILVTFHALTVGNFLMAKLYENPFLPENL